MLFELGCCSAAVDCIEVMATLPKPDIILSPFFLGKHIQRKLVQIVVAVVAE